MSPAQRILICIPTYNERENIPVLSQMIWKRVSSSVEVLFVDDNSPDGSGELLESMALENKRIHVLRRRGKLGLASAYLNAFRWGLEHGYDWVVQMDADLSHSPEHLVEFERLMASRQWDVVCGSRYIPGGGVSNWSRSRVLLSRAGSLYSSLVLGTLKLKDWTGGFNAWSRKALMEMRLGSVKSRGYVFQVELKYRAILTGQRLVETPIVFAEREHGVSKMSGSIVREALLQVPRLRFQGAELVS
jgi:dolichol-phosphate mannosyltransferase